MKKVTVFILLNLINSHLFSQLLVADYYNYTINRQVPPSNLAFSYDSSFNSKGKLISVKKNKYNPKGKLEYSYDSKFKSEEFINYYKDSIVQKVVYLRNKDTFSVWWHEFDESGNRIKYVLASKSINKPKYSTLTFYDEQKREIRKENINNKNAIINYTTYIYSDSGKMVERRYYNKKGKLLSVYSYNCDKKGETKKNVNNINFCSNNGRYEDGRYYFIDEKIVNGKTIRSVYTYSPDSLIVSYEYSNVKTNENNKIIFEYNENRLLSKVLIFDKKGRIKTTNMISYGLHGERKEFKYFDGNNKLKSITKTTYTFHNSL
ncbi:MAG: hypothetical protein ACK4K9_11310 [Bacteroidia bacterium]